MGYTKKPFEELDVMDDYLINAIAADEEVGEAFCRKVISVLLQRKIGKIRIIAQCTIPARTPEHRGIRMDVKIEEFGDESKTQLANVYDLEPHLRNDMNLLKHNRFYQAKSDSQYLRSGERDFNNMPNLFVITILNFDPFGYDYMMYTIRNRCMEISELEYEDGLRFIYFYTGGTKGGSKEIKTVLQYLQDSTAANATDATTRELHDYVSRVKVMLEVREGYMEFDDYIYFQRKDERRDTKVQDILELLEDYGEIPEELREKLMGTGDFGLLKKFHKLAARVNSIEEFMEKME